MKKGKLKKFEVKTFGAELATSYPDEIEDIFSRIKSWLSHPQLNPDNLKLNDVILQKYKTEAERKLKNHGYETEPSDLLYLDDFQMGIEDASLKKVILTAYHLSEDIQTEDDIKIFTNTILLISALINGSINPTGLFNEIESMSKDIQRKHEDITRMKPSYQSMQERRRRLKNERDLRTEDAKKKSSEWLKQAKGIKSKNPNLSIRSIARLICEKNNYNIKTQLQTVYKSLLKNKKSIKNLSF